MHVYIEKDQIFNKLLFAGKTARRSFGKWIFSAFVKVESVLRLNTKVEDYEILHMLTKI
jgi:hypothetical protein